ncbi:MAG: hypothetical protein OXD54_11355 [Candidatus Poribacteria bacterium]|nr:hypothetical protein [Candidatus Poribacteria bacterium]
MTIMRLCLYGLFATFLIVLPANAALDADNIMGIWLFNKGNGNTAEDSSGNGNDGKINGGAKWVDGQFGKALEFDGTDDWVEVQHSDTVAFKKGVSFSITLHYKGSSVGGSLVGKGYEDTTQAKPWYLLWNGGGDQKVSFYLRTSADLNSRIDSTVNVSDEKWHFIAAIADADAKKISLWIDGKKDVEGVLSTDEGYGTSESVFHIARHFDRYTKGIIDDVGLFNVALSENEMNTVMNEGMEAAASVDAVDKLTTTWGDIKQKW